MLPLGIKNVIPIHTCLTAIKNILPELTYAELSGPRRWSSVLSLPEILSPINGDLILWADYYHKNEFVPRHIALILNYHEGFIYHMTANGNDYEPKTMITQDPFYINKLEYTKFVRPKYSITE